MPERPDPRVIQALDRFEAAFREAIREPLRDLIRTLEARQERRGVPRVRHGAREPRFRQ